jgi:probable RNA-binding protein EIF1AD
MAGLGRRSHYRKHLTDAVWNDLPEPKENECIGKVIGTRGSNQFEVVLAPFISKDVQEDGNHSSGSLDKTPQLAILPTKFRKLIWVKRNDYVICSCAQEEGTENEAKENEPRSTSIEGGIRYMIAHILYKDQVKHLKEIKKWPIDPFFSEQLNEGDDDEETELREKAKAIMKQEKDKEATKDGTDAYDDDDDEGEEDHYGQYNEDGYEDDENGIVYGNDECDDYLVNMNRIAKMKIEDSSSDEDSD